MTQPIVSRSTIKTQVGVEVDSLDLTIGLTSDVTVGSLPLSQFIAGGGLDGASVSVDRSFYARGSASAAGNLNLFTGSVADVQVDATEAVVSVKSTLQLLNIQMPRNLYMAQCQHTLYDSGCTLNAANFTTSSVVTTGPDKLTVPATGLTQADGYFDLGTITFTSGVNNGLTRSVRSYSSKILHLSYPLPQAPGVGDSFGVKPGCDKLLTTCNSSKFNNVIHFRGYPFIPIPETSY